MNLSTLQRFLLFAGLVLKVFVSIAQIPPAGNAPFVDVTDSSGIQHQFKVYEGMFGGGICVFDMDNDGLEDVYLTSGMNDDQLYRNLGNGKFQLAFEGSGLELTRKYVTLGVAGADVNRDGWVDLFVTTLTSRVNPPDIPRARNLLFLNQGNGKFVDATEAYGLADLYSFSTGISFGDVNADGWPDAYVGNYFLAYEGELTYISDATIAGSNQTAKGYLLINEGGQRFRDAFQEYGLQHRGFGFGALFTDYDNDGDPDLLVNHDFGYKAFPSLLLENRFPRKRFRDVSVATGFDLKINAMGAAIGDLNEDGYFDYLVTNIKFNRMMMSQGKGKPYVNQAKELGMKTLAISWGANMVDFDHDGYLEVFVSNGDLNPYCTPMGNFYFENDKGKIVDRSVESGLKDYGIGRGSVVFDMDNDGDLDLLVVNQESVRPGYPVPSITRLYRNDAAKGAWLKVRLKGSEAESHGMGSRVILSVNGRRMMREIDGGGSSHLSQNSTLAHFGLGNATAVDSLIVVWTGGKKQVLVNVQVNQLVEVGEAKGDNPVSIWPMVVAALFVAGFGWLIWRRRKRASVGSID